jgi:hypothetical protein
MKVLALLLSCLSVLQGKAQTGCNFSLEGGADTAVKINSSTIVTSRLHIVKQPGSPVEIVAVDLNGLALAVSNDGYSYHSEALGRVEVLNRSDREVDHVLIGFQIGSCRQVGHIGSLARPRRLSLPPGGAARFEMPFGSGGGVTSASLPLEVFVWISSVELNGCTFRPSLAIPCESAQ